MKVMESEAFLAKGKIYAWYRPEPLGLKRSHLQYEHILSMKF